MVCLIAGNQPKKSLVVLWNQTNKLFARIITRFVQRFKKETIKLFFWQCKYFGNVYIRYTFSDSFKYHYFSQFCAKMCKKRLKTKKVLNCRLHVVIKMWNKYSFADFLCLGVLHLAGRKKEKKNHCCQFFFFLLGCVCFERTNCLLFFLVCCLLSFEYNYIRFIQLRRHLHKARFLTSQHWQKNSTTQTSSVFKNNI